MANLELRVGGHVIDYLGGDFVEWDSGYNALFQEGDEISKGAGVFRASRADMISRLDLLGYSLEESMRRFHEWLKDTQESDFLPFDRVDYAWWRNIVKLRLEDALPCESEMDELEKYFATYYFDEPTSSGMWFDGYGSLACVRIFIEILDDAKKVELDISNAIAEGCYPSDEKPTLAARNSTRLVLGAPTMIMGEGSSDISVLRSSLAKLYPELSENFTFFDHAIMKTDGSANMLVKFIKAFATVNIPQKIIAIFDNDPAGHNAVADLNRYQLPKNIMVMNLPNTEFARSYPTTGPQGSHPVDVNGMACGIEMYFGESVLRDAEGSLMPVVWTARDTKSKVYQGEIEDKGKAQDLFYAAIADSHSREEARARFPELDLVWKHIFERVRSFHSDQTLAEWSQRSF